MLDSIKATLTKVLGPESAHVVEFYVDKHLALKDPVAFERALTDFLGSQAGRLLIDAIRSDLRRDQGETSKHGPVSRFLRESETQSPSVRILPIPPKERAVRKEVSAASASYQERLIKIVGQATDKNTTFRSLVTECLVESQGATCAYATIACLGRRALEDPAAFIAKVAATFGLEGAVLLESLTRFCERRVNGPQARVL